MSTTEMELARAAASLTEEEILWIQERGQQITPRDSHAPNTQEDRSEEMASQECGSQEDASENAATEEDQDRDQKRRKVEHEWPPVGAILEACYEGTRYEAEVISMPRYKSGRAIRILTGPAAGEVERSMSGAMLTATMGG